MNSIHCHPRFPLLFFSFFFWGLQRHFNIKNLSIEPHLCHLLCILFNSFTSILFFFPWYSTAAFGPSSCWQNLSIYISLLFIEMNPTLHHHLQIFCYAKLLSNGLISMQSTRSPLMIADRSIFSIFKFHTLPLFSNS